MNRLSAILITKNAERHLVKCLESVKWADEIIILDSGSTDRTVAIIKEYTSNLIQGEWEGYGKQRNRVLSYATGQWILAIDADEILSVEAAQSIKNILHEKTPQYHAYQIQRCSQYCGRIISHGDWRSDYVVRFFLNHPEIRFSERQIHESLIVNPPLGRLKGVIWHYPFDDTTQVLNKVNQYSTLGALQAFNAQKKSSVLKALGKSLFSFIRGYFIKLGFLDGREGFLLAVSNALGIFYRYIKIIYLYQDKQP